MEPFKHVAHVLHGCHKDRAQEFISRRNWLARLLLENLRKLIVGQIVTGE